MFPPGVESRPQHHMQEITHLELSRVTAPNSPLRHHGTEPTPAAPSPALGADNAEILCGLLGLDQETVINLRRDGSSRRPCGHSSSYSRFLRPLAVQQMAVAVGRAERCAGGALTRAIRPAHQSIGSTASAPSSAKGSLHGCAGSPGRAWVPVSTSPRGSVVGSPRSLIPLVFLLRNPPPIQANKEPISAD
jgi:hypothetical protein